MYKALCVAVVVVVGLLALTGRSSSTASTTFTSPLVVAKGKLINQGAPIPRTTIFTPTQSGVYRVSPYMSMTAPASTGFWTFDLYWTDEGGANEAQMVNLDSTRSPAYGVDPTGSMVSSFTFRAIAGQPVSYDVTDGGSGAGGTYEVFFAIERLF